MSWSTELDTAIDLYNAEDYNECIAHIRAVHRDNTPNYARVRYRSLLAYCLDDWYGAENERSYAYAHWCLFNPTGSYPGVDRIRTDLRTDLDQLAEYLRTFRPDDWKDHQRFWNNAEATEAQAEYAAEWAEAEEEVKAAVVKREEQEGQVAVTAHGENEEGKHGAVKREEDKDSTFVKVGEEHMNTLDGNEYLQEEE